MVFYKFKRDLKAYNKHIYKNCGGAEISILNRQRKRKVAFPSEKIYAWWRECLEDGDINAGMLRVSIFFAFLTALSI